MVRRKRGGRWHAREQFRFPRAGRVYYFRRFSASASTAGARAGWTSQGFKLPRLTVNTTTGTYTWDNPGPGSYANNIPEWLYQALPNFLTKQPERSAR